jgi:SAM-dependent methyltransferase
VFAGVPMSTSRTGAEQLASLRRNGFTVGELAVRRDVDTMDDARAVAALAPGTRFAQTLRRIELAGEGHPPVDLYDDAVAGLRSLHLVAADGRRLPFLLDRWSADVDAVDLALLARCEGKTLDVGCGPGRMTAALAAAGRPVLGVDVSGSAIRSTVDSGALALQRSVFDALPGEGRWGTVLLADGNLGIGGDPDAMLRRVGELLRPGGLLLVEPEGREVDELIELRLQSVDGGLTSEGFTWARVGPDAVRRRAVAAGYDVEDAWSDGGRAFVALRR